MEFDKNSPKFVIFKANTAQQFDTAKAYIDDILNAPFGNGGAVGSAAVGVPDVLPRAAAPVPAPAAATSVVSAQGPSSQVSTAQPGEPGTAATAAKRPIDPAGPGATKRARKAVVARKEGPGTASAAKRPCPIAEAGQAAESTPPPKRACKENPSTAESDTRSTAAISSPVQPATASRLAPALAANASQPAQDAPTAAPYAPEETKRPLS